MSTGHGGGVAYLKSLSMESHVHAACYRAFNVNQQDTTSTWPLLTFKPTAAAACFNVCIHSPNHKQLEYNLSICTVDS